MDLERAMNEAEAAGAAPEVLRVPAGVLASGCAAVAAARPDRIDEQEAALAAAVAITMRLTGHHDSEGGPEVEARSDCSCGWDSAELRADAALNVMQLCHIQSPPDAALLRVAEDLLGDPHPTVRCNVVKHLDVLWSVDQALMWRLAERVAREEADHNVLRSLTNFFLNHLRANHLRAADPERVEALLFIIRERLLSCDRRDDEPWRGVLEDIGALLAILWVWDDRAHARSIVASWCADPVSHETELDAALSAIRNSLVLGYKGDSPANEAVRRRGQKLVALTVGATAQTLAAFYEADRETQSADADRARIQAKMLDHACSQLYFASGALSTQRESEERGLQASGEKRAFLVDIEPILRRIGDVGTPHTIHQRLQLLEFLLPVDPARAFNLVAHALLEGGRRQGYQYESLGADAFARLIGLCLADHRSLFRDERRRQRLIDCIDAFIEAGWPAARRLLYRLPELLQ